MIIVERHFIGGAWTVPHSSETIEIIDSFTEQPMGIVPAGSRADVDAAAHAAASAFPSWSATSPAARGEHLLAIRDGLMARSSELAQIITRETGMPERMATRVQVGFPIVSFSAAARLAQSYRFETTLEGSGSVVVREPIGVVGCITPWNYPLHQIAAKVAYAMAAGCTVVLKPSEIAPLDAFLLAEVIEQGGLPPGVFNLVSGTGPEVGEAIVAHDQIDMVSFTGSTRAGRRVAQLCAERVKKVALELGGKSANILADDLDEAAFARAVKVGVDMAFFNSGQTCSALSRMLVPQARMSEAEAAAAAAVGMIRVGDPFDEATKLGPLASGAQRARVREYIRTGLAEGAHLVAGGPEAPDGLDTGFFVRPTVFSRVEPWMTIAREEIFGPVLSIMPYADIDDAVRLANDSEYGLAGGVTAADEDLAWAIARRLRTGQVSVNGAPFNPEAPFGGYKQSGIGRECGEHGFEEFLEVKSIQGRQPTGVAHGPRPPERSAA